jgi:hypothetical protein
MIFGRRDSNATRRIFHYMPRLDFHQIGGLEAGNGGAGSRLKIQGISRMVDAHKML